MTLRTRLLIAVVVCLLAVPVFAQYSTSAPYAALTVPSDTGDSCRETWYYPNIHLMPDGMSLGMLTQAGVRNPCEAFDSFYAAQRDQNGTWTVPALNACPTLDGQYTRCGYDNISNFGPIAHPSVIRLSNSNSASGQRYFMAFSGGNSDYIQGKLYWAYSDDGANWSVYNWNAPENWTPIVSAKYLRDTGTPRSATGCQPPTGIAAVNLAYENGYIYLFLMYNHSVQPECACPCPPGGHTSAACEASPYWGYDRANSALLLRFTYDPNHPYGFGAGGYQIYYNGAWASESGNLTWAYDVDANGNQLPADPNNPVLTLTSGPGGFQFGAGDVKYGNGKWLHAVFDWSGQGFQTATCLDPTACSWSAVQTLDDSAIKAVYSNIQEIEGAGLYYGALRKADGTYTGTHWWFWIPAPTNNTVCFNPDGSRSVFSGLSVVPTQLCTPDVLCGN